MTRELSVEQRLAALENAVAELRKQQAMMSAPTNWIERVTGIISDQDAFSEALAYGRAVREADRPADLPDDNP